MINRKIVDVLKEKAYVESENLLIIEDEGATHSEYHWSKRFPDAVLWLLGKVNIS